MRSIAQAIARCDGQLRFIPTIALKQLRILALLNETTGTELSMLHANDDLARDRSTMIWPISPWRVLKMPALGPTYNVLSLFNQIYEAIWDHRPQAAFAVPDLVYLNSLLYEFVLREMDRRHLVLYLFPTDADGCQLVLSLSRRHEDGQPYKPADLRAVDQICAHFTDEFTAAPPGPHAPRHAVPEEHSVELDAELRPKTTSLYVRALFALFYGRPLSAADGHARLPAALEDEIRRNRDVYLSSVQTVESGFAHAFTKHHCGRVLSLTVQTLPSGVSRLTIHEDGSRHASLRRIMAACRALERDRTSVFSACLVVAEGVRDVEEIAKRAGFGALKPASALRIINQARTIVAQA